MLDLNAETVREASVNRASRFSTAILRGEKSLHHAHLEQARVLVLAISDPIATRRTVRLAREMNPDIHIIVRTRYMSELPDLYKLGAKRGHPRRVRDEHRDILARAQGVQSRNLIQREIESISHEGYEMLRLPSPPHIELSDIAEALGSSATETLFIQPDSPVVGKTLGKLDLRKKTGATIIAAIREGEHRSTPALILSLPRTILSRFTAAPKRLKRLWII